MSTRKVQQRCVGLSCQCEPLEARQLLATFMVTNIDDSGAGSLRQAILDANDAAGADIVEFDGGLAGSTITLTTEELAITDDLTINGLGTGLLAVSGNDEWGVFSNSATTFIGNLQITGAGPSSSGGIDNQSGSLTIYRCVVTGNNGAINNDSGVMEIIESTISGNYGVAGAGVFNYYGDMTIDRSLIVGNAAINGLNGPPGSGSNSGGGVFNLGTLEIRNSTISGNSVSNGFDTFGGGVYNRGTLEVYNSTITENRLSTTDGNGGGGIYNDGGTVTLQSTIVAGNFSTSYLLDEEVADDLGGAFDAGSSNNLVGDAGTAGSLEDGVNGNIVGVNPRLGTLAFNGGPTRTHALLSGSPAIDQGENPLDLETDQRGQPRSFGQTDIGAYERQLFGLGAIAGGRATGDSIADGSHQVLLRNTEGSLVVFDGGDEAWAATRLRDFTGAPTAIADGALWTDARDGLTYIAAPTKAGLVLFGRDSAGVWSYRNLTGTAGVGNMPAQSLTVFVSKAGRISVAGVSGAGALVVMSETGQVIDGQREWGLINLSARLAAQGMTTPDFTELTSYVTPWDAWTIAGIDSAGDIQGVWISPALDDWRVDNLSAITGATPLSGQLSVTQTSWKAINLAGVDSAGNLVVTWWVPGYGGTWVTSNLTTAAAGPALTVGQLAGFTTSWGSINYAGVDVDGEVVAYWWVPTTNHWAADLLVADLGGNEASSHPLTASVSSRGTLSVYATGTVGNLLRFSWTPGDGAFWSLSDLTTSAERNW